MWKFTFLKGIWEQEDIINNILAESDTNYEGGITINSFNILIGGEAGQGLKTVSHILGKALYRMGFSVFTSRDFMSRIRGGHNFDKVRFGSEDIAGPSDKVDIIVALNEETVVRHRDELKEDGVIITEKKDAGGENVVEIPAGKIAGEINPKGINTVYLGALIKILGLDRNECEKVIAEFFEDEGIVDDNCELLEKGYHEVEERYEVTVSRNNENRIYLDGKDAIGLGAMAAGVKFYTAYPMSPSTGIMNYLAGKQRDGGPVVEQAESEIGAINMALGAAYGGVRAMTGTSGGGFALMAEGMGLAGITETPLVVAEIQRPGPATGLPTRTEQGDLQFVINVSQGEFPLVVLAPRDQEDAFYQTFRAFNLAEKYQLPVVILGDQFLVDSSRSVEEFDFESLEIERHLLSPAEQEGEYKRYEITADGISPRAYPGQLPGQTVLVDSDEHDEAGHITESAEVRKAMVDKRMKKMDRLREEDLQEPEYIGREDADYLLAGWGSTRGPLLEAQKLLSAEGISAGVLSFADVWPLPRQELESRTEGVVKFITVENNATGQFANLVRQETGIKADNEILKYDGSPFSGKEITRRVKEVITQ